MWLFSTVIANFGTTNTDPVSVCLCVLAIYNNSGPVLFWISRLVGFSRQSCGLEVIMSRQPFTLTFTLLILQYPQINNITNIRTLKARLILLISPQRPKNLNILPKRKNDQEKSFPYCEIKWAENTSPIGPRCVRNGSCFDGLRKNFESALI